MAEGLEALLRSAQAALSAASATLPSAEGRRAEAAAAESLAVSGAGAVAKPAAVGVAGRLRRQWLRWLTEHGDAYEYDATVGPTVEHVLHFTRHGNSHRKITRCVHGAMNYD